MRRVISKWKDPACFVMPNGNFCENVTGPGRRFLVVKSLPYREEALRLFGFNDLIDEPSYQNFIGNHYVDAAYTTSHQDNAPHDYIHVRANWMIKKPLIGGDPVFDGQVVQVQAGDLWICFSSEEMHGSTPISGGERLICSFGALVPREQALRAMEQVQ